MVYTMKTRAEHRTMNIRMTHAGQLFLDAESELVFMEASLLCVVLSCTIVKVVTELSMEWQNEGKFPKCLSVRRLCLMTKISDNFFVLKGLGAFWPLSGREFRLKRKRDELSQAFPP